MRDAAVIVIRGLLASVGGSFSATWALGGPRWMLLIGAYALWLLLAFYNATQRKDTDHCLRTGLMNGGRHEAIIMVVRAALRVRHGEPGR